MGQHERTAVEKELLRIPKPWCSRIAGSGKIKKRRSPISSTFLPIHHRCDIFLRSKKGNESIHIVTFSVICTKLQMLCPTTIVFSSKCVAKIVDTVKPEVSISDHPVWLISAFSLQFQDWTQYNTNKIHKHKYKFKDIQIHKHKYKS